MKKEKKIPVFVHIPKNAGTYVLSWTMMMFRWYGISQGWNNKVGWNVNLRRILLQHENRQIATVFVYDPKNIREHNKHFISHKTDPHCNIVELSSFLNEIENNSFTIFSIIIEDLGIKFISNGLYEKICKTESATPLYYCLLRHPYDRAESMFNYLTSSNSAHEPSFNALKSKTFQEYARSVELEDSWLIRMVVAISDNQPIDDNIFNQACSILDRVRFSDVNNVDALINHVFGESYGINQRVLPDEWVNVNVNSSKIPKTKFSELDKTTKIAFLARTKFDRKLYKRFTKNQTHANLPLKKIYTYFEDIGFNSSQQSLLNLWKESWKNQGFDAIVLTREHAEQSPYYAEFVSDLKQVHFNITGKEMRPYGLSCYLRWLAYSTQTDLESVLVSDYDVINKSFKFTEIVESTNKISFMDRYCPCLAYGTPEQFLEFCKDLITISSKYVETLKTQHAENNCRFYHDQEFLWLNCDRIDYNFCPVRKYVRLYEHKHPSIEKAALFHIAHRSADETQQNFPEFAGINESTLRVLLAKDLLKDIISDEILNEATRILS